MKYPVLLIDTSSRHLVFARLNSEGTGEVLHALPGARSEDAIDNAVEKLFPRIEEIGEIWLGEGPGSFVGLRSSFAYARMLAMLAGTPCRTFFSSRLWRVLFGIAPAAWLLTRTNARLFYADRFTPEDEKRRARETGEEAAAIPFLKRFTVFNAAQCDGLPKDVAIVFPPPPPGLIEPQVEALIRATGIDFRIGGDRAFYVPALDYVQVPPPQAYFEPINWHRTALHELGHATGHTSRLNRDFSGSFGSKKYAFEELIAEINAAFCCASLGIAPTVRHADYIGSWLEVLREDNRAILRAASQASKAADWLLGFLPSTDVDAADHERQAA